MAVMFDGWNSLNKFGGHELPMERYCPPSGPLLDFTPKQFTIVDSLSLRLQHDKASKAQPKCCESTAPDPER